MSLFGNYLDEKDRKYHTMEEETENPYSENDKGKT